MNGIVIFDREIVTLNQSLIWINLWRRYCTAVVGLTDPSRAFPSQTEAAGSLAAFFVLSLRPTNYYLSISLNFYLR